MLGPHELAASLREGRPCRLSSDLAVHISELVKTIQNPDPSTSVRRLQTEFKPIAPLPELAAF
jgi:hypothetical protein